jgi:hypothetical protein
MGDDKALELKLAASQPSKLYSIGSALRSTYPEVYEGLGADVVQLMLHLTVLSGGAKGLGAPIGALSPQRRRTSPGESDWARERLRTDVGTREGRTRVSVSHRRASALRLIEQPALIHSQKRVQKAGTIEPTADVESGGKLRFLF